MPLDHVRQWLLSAREMIGAAVVSPDFYLQLGLVALCALVAWASRALFRARFDVSSMAMGWPGRLRRFMRVLVGSAPIAVFAALVFLLGILIRGTELGGSAWLLLAAAQLALTWLAIRLVISAIRDPLLVSLVSLLAWCIAVLGIVGQLQTVSAALDSVAIVLGDLRLSPLLVIKLVVLLALALWASKLLSQFLESRISHASDLTPSMQVLLIKLTHVVLMVLAVVLVLSAVGINLSALAIFSGAVGVGIGLGLQKIVSNFISGVILLVDKSVKPGDLVSIGDSTGRISAMNTRYISIAAGDGRAILVPNEDLVTQKVVNWTYSDTNALVKVKFGAAYDSDPRRVCQLAIDVAAASERVSTAKSPGCLLAEFGESGMQFGLTFWVTDPSGMDSARSEVLMALWDAFKREDIRMPYPVRDIRMATPPAADAPAGGSR